MSVSNPSREPVDNPAWDVALLFPPQGQWSEADYLALETNRLVELADGTLEVLGMPTEFHQAIVLFLYESVLLFTRPTSMGKVLVAPLRIRLATGRYREPDVVFMLAANYSRRSDQFWDGADLVMEVVSDDDPNRDWLQKRNEYAAAGIPEYWIADPRDRSISVFKLEPGATRYADVPKTFAGDSARSFLLPGFTVAVSDVFDRD